MGEREWISCLDGGSEKYCWESGLGGWSSLITCIILIQYSYIISIKKNRYISFQLLALYLAVIQTLLATIYYFFWHNTGIEYASLFVEQNVFFVVSLYYARFAIRALNLLKYKEKILYPTFGILYSASLIILIVSSTVPNAFECQNFLWLGFSIVMVVLSCSLLISGYLIWQRMQGVIVTGTVLKSKRNQLWVLIIVWMLSAIYTVIFQIYVTSNYPDEDSCRQFFDIETSKEMERVFLLYFTYVIGSLLPLWVMLIVFKSMNDTGATRLKEEEEGEEEEEGIESDEDIQ